MTSYAEISLINNTDEKTVREAIKKTSRLLGLALRKTRAGRPPGRKETKRRNNPAR